MKIGIYNPYLDTLGGGENYTFSIAECLADNNEVDIFWNDATVLERARKRFSFELKNIDILPNIFLLPFHKKIKTMAQYDVIFFVSDGSIPFLTAKKNILLMQYPVNWIKGKSLLNRLKFKKIDHIICYSSFVKHHLDRTFPKKTSVLAPSVDINFISKKKENVILTVGRFTKAMNTKKQEVLIDAFKQGYSTYFRDWKLIVAGSVLAKDQDYVKSLQEESKGYPIEVIANVSYKTLRNYYEIAKIYWHAAGFREDLERYPERAEHFGISTVEAMGAGAVPVVINAGGQKEIVTEGEDGFLWKTLEELQDKTQLLTTDESLWKKISEQAKIRARDFSRERFCEKINSLIGDRG